MSPASGGAILIGRDRGTCDQIVDQPGVSLSHCQLFLDQSGAGWMVEDLGSTNGTYLDGIQLRPHAAVPIRLGQKLGIGRSFAVTVEAQLFEKLSWSATCRGPMANGSSAGDTPPPEVPTPSVGRALTIGRDTCCDIVIDAHMVSAQHARLTPMRPGRWLIEDLGATNGLFVGHFENRVTRAEVGDGDVLFLGSYRLPLQSLTGPMSTGAGRLVRLPASGAITLGRGGSATIRFEAPQVSAVHAEISNVGSGVWEIRDLGSRNGTFVNGERVVRSAPVKLSDAVSLGSFRISLLASSAPQDRFFPGNVAIRANRVSFDVPDKKAPTRRKRLLHDVSFTVYPSEFVGLLGPSGAGKTTLLRAMNGYARPTEGATVINGVDFYRHYEAFQNDIGYVPQDDIVFPQLTVEESLRFTARLRLPPDTSKAEIDKRIDSLVRMLEIPRTRDVRIGDALNRGISGGERKRVNLAQELLTQPSMLFLDEPTSGLSSEDTIQVMQLLRRLANGGATIILTIHQPSLEAYKLLDNAIYLFEGRLIYYGPAWPDSIEFLNGPHPTALRDDLISDPGNALKALAIEQRQASSESDPAAREARLQRAADARREAFQHSPYHRSFVAEREIQMPPAADAVRAARRRKPAPFLHQLILLCQRLALIKLRDRVNTLLLLLQAPVIALVMNLSFVHAMNDGYFPALGRSPATLFLLIVAAIWFGCSNSAREIVSEQSVYQRERMVNLRIDSYLLSKVLVGASLCAVQCCILLFGTWFTLGFDGNFGSMLLTLVLSSWGGLGMGLVLSASVRSLEAAGTLVPILLIPQIILGGLVIPATDFPPAIRSFAGGIVARWGFEAMLHIEHGNDDAKRLLEECAVAEDGRKIGEGYRCAWSPAPVAAFYLTEGSIEPRRPGETPRIAPPANHHQTCRSICPALGAGEPLTPLDRSFGVNWQEPARSEAAKEIPADELGSGKPSVRMDPDSEVALQWLWAILGVFDLTLFLAAWVVLHARDPLPSD